MVLGLFSFLPRCLSDVISSFSWLSGLYSSPVNRCGIWITALDSLSGASSLRPVSVLAPHLHRNSPPPDWHLPYSLNPEASDSKYS
ncbi:hypothetical protein BD779DRAFT_520858 [Infundibulicybe gibba]|nr:hypothetical protein BD779DRAFT_520858 [Infundibulicybe gibba]